MLRQKVGREALSQKSVFVVRGSLFKDYDLRIHGYSSDGPREFDSRSNDVNGSLQLTTGNRQLAAPRKAFEQRRALLFHFHQTKVEKEDLANGPPAPALAKARRRERRDLRVQSKDSKLS